MFPSIYNSIFSSGDFESWLANNPNVNEMGMKMIWWNVCQGLEYLHHRGIVHCDIKPQNILMNEDGSPVIADFDISINTENRTQTTKGIGTIRYIAPGNHLISVFDDC